MNFSQTQPPANALPLVWVFQVLISHWRRKPTQFATMIIGLACATALFSGVQALNMQARASYADAARVLGADQFPTLRAANGDSFDQTDYVALRRSGLPVSPIVRASIALPRRRMTLIGIDLVTIPIAAAPVRLAGKESQNGEVDITRFLGFPWQAVLSPLDMESLGLQQLILDGEFRN